MYNIEASYILEGIGGLDNIQYTQLYIVHFTEYTLNCTMYNVHLYTTLYIVQCKCTLYNVQYIIKAVSSSGAGDGFDIIQYSIHCTLYSVHLYIVHCTVYIVQNCILIVSS